MNNLSSAQIQQLKSAYGQAEILINGEVWTRFSSMREWKVSPHGERGDYDSDSYWVDFEEVNSL
jgi:hypothetical protein